MKPLQLVVYDATDTGAAHAGVSAGRSGRDGDGRARGGRGLSPIWRAGAVLHRLTRAADACLAASSWDEALGWAAEQARRSGRPVASLQVWGHGGWGRATAALPSSPRAPNTISCFRLGLPAGM